MKITYLYNSGFAVEVGNMLLILDYYNTTSAKGAGTVDLQDLAKYDRIYIFASHAHPDHFNAKAIQGVMQAHPQVKVILSNDIRSGGKNSIKGARFLSFGESYSDAYLLTRAYRSTDEGIAFYIAVNDYMLFHAGDYNCWHWQDEADASYARQARDAFYEVLDTIKAEVPRLDAAMFPVDPRLGTDFDEGARAFIEAIQCDLFVPMHFRGSADKLGPFLDYARKRSQSVWLPRSSGDRIEV